MEFRRTSHCSSGSCVELCTNADGVILRDGKDSDGPRLHFSREEWSAFIAGVKAGEFDL